jgi:putative hydrolase of the HAD superfamily
MARPKVLLFDLGGVLVEFVGLAELQRLLGAVGAGEVRARWMASPALAKFEIGQCSPSEFAQRFVEEWQLGLRPADFLQQFASWAKPPSAETFEMLAELRTRHALACLSNTNVVHWEQMLEGYGLRKALDRHFASHELGLLKPKPEAYAQVAHELGCNPGEITFFDDSQDNVNGAISAGLSAHLVASHDQLRPTLARLGLAEPVAS